MAIDVNDPVSLVRLAMGGENGLGSTSYFSDADILSVLSVQPVVTYAAAILVDSLCAQFLLEVDFSSGQTSYKASQKVKACVALAERLRANPGDFIGGDGTGVPSANVFAGGQSKADMRSLANDADLPQPSFTIGQFDDETSNQDDDTCLF